jgi:Cu/Ag efflux protein CusF
MTFKAVLASAVVLMVPALCHAQRAVTKGDVVMVEAVIQAIDQTSRMVTLKTASGDVETVYAGPEVKRFKELKVGDTVKATYYESLVFMVRKPGVPTAGRSTDLDVVGTRGTGPTPSATAALQATTTVDVQSVDPTVPSITVKTEDGRTVTRRVDDKKNLEGVKAGDRIDITYTQALVIGIERAK